MSRLTDLEDKISAEIKKLEDEAGVEFTALKAKLKALFGHPAVIAETNPNPVVVADVVNGAPAVLVPNAASVLAEQPK